MKQCTKCKKLKSKSEYSKNRKNKDGLRCWCKDCEREYKRRYYRKNGGTVKKYFIYEERHRTIDGLKQKRCSKCEKWKDESKFGKDSKNKDGLKYWCKDCGRADMRERYKKEGKGLKTYYRYEECHRVVDGVKQKRCRSCKRWKAESDFYKVRINKEGLAVWCKECAIKATNKARKKRLKQKRCGRCKKWKAESEFYKNRLRKDGLRFLCKECSKKAYRNSRKKRRTAVRN